jgi:hypothetical protein
MSLGYSEHVANETPVTSIEKNECVSCIVILFALDLCYGARYIDWTVFVHKMLQMCPSDITAVQSNKTKGSIFLFGFLFRK